MLRQVTPADVETVVALSCDPRVNEHRPGGAPSPEQARVIANGFIEDWERDGIGYWIVEYQERVAGIAGVKLVELDNAQYWNLYYRLSTAMA